LIPGPGVGATWPEERPASAAAIWRPGPACWPVWRVVGGQAPAAGAAPARAGRLVAWFIPNVTSLLWARLALGLGGGIHGPDWSRAWAKRAGKWEPAAAAGVAVSVRPLPPFAKGRTLAQGGVAGSPCLVPTSRWRPTCSAPPFSLPPLAGACADPGRRGRGALPESERLAHPLGASCAPCKNSWLVLGFGSFSLSCAIPSNPATAQQIASASEQVLPRTQPPRPWQSRWGAGCRGPCPQATLGAAAGPAGAALDGDSGRLSLNSLTPPAGQDSGTRPRSNGVVILRFGSRSGRHPNGPAQPLEQGGVIGERSSPAQSGPAMGRKRTPSTGKALGVWAAPRARPRSKGFLHLAARHSAA